MQEWDYLMLTIIYGDNEKVDSVYRDGRVIYVGVSWSMIMEYIDGLKLMQWEIIHVVPMGWGESYHFRRRILDTLHP